MGIRFRRSVRIAPGVKINVTKTGLGMTVGPKGAHYSVHSSGRKTKSVGLPGTGLYYQEVSGGHPRAKASQAPSGPGTAPAQPPARLAASTRPAQRGSRKGLVGVGAVAVVAVAYAVGAGGGSPAPSQTPAGTVPALGVLGAAGTPSPTPLAVEQPSPSGPAATAKPKAAPKPGATPRPTARAGALALSLSLSSPVSHNSSATASARTAAGARCSITVEYASGPSSAAGLGDKTAGSGGAVTWTWKIGGRTTPGSWPVTVTCTKGSLSKSLTKDIRITG